MNPNLPDRIGDYRVLRRLGEGGMGVVYEAEQREPRRLVAVKVIRGGDHVDETTVRLFRREAQALARLKHPAIAAVYASGRTDDGRPFFAMELVPGEDLQAHLAASGGAAPRDGGEMRRRLALFRKVVDAVAYAHQRGVVHRDLKPSNILVNGDEPKVLDFGLARMTDSDLTVSTVVSEAGTIRGTLPYMAPEQLAGNADAIDVRTDVYALGVILYEMLSGRQPIPLEGVPFPMIPARILEERPRPLGVDPELDTIVLKTLEKEPERRYASAAALGEDLDRFLTGRPILARPPSAAYQLRKLVLRHKLPFTLAAALIVSLLAFSVATLVQARRVAAERDRANVEAATTRKVTDFLVSIFKVSDPSEARGNSVTAREILDQGATRLEKELADQPEVRNSLEDAVGRVYQSLGLYDKAKPMLERALAEREARLGPDHPEVAASLNSLGWFLFERGDFPGARAAHERALAIRERALGPDHPDTAISMNQLANVYKETGEFEKALPLQRRVLAIWEREYGPDHPRLATILNNIANVERELHDLDGARAAHERALAILEKPYGPDHPNVAIVLNNLGVLLKDQGKLDEALAVYRRGLAIREKAYGPDHPRIATSLHNIAIVLFDLGRYDEAREYDERALAIQEKASGPDHPNVAHMVNALGNVELKAGHPEAAAARFERALAIWEKSVGASNPLVASPLVGLARVDLAAGRLDAARARLDRAAAIVKANPGGEPPDVAGAYAELERAVANRSTSSAPL